MESKNLTGYPSIDKPWLKYYTAEAITAPLPEGTIYQYMMSRNAENLDANALNYFGKTITYRAFDRRIDECARALIAFGVKPGDFVSICELLTPEAAILIYAINKIGAVSNMIVLNATVEEIQHQLNLTGSKIVFTLDLALDKLTTAATGTAADKIIVIPIAASMPAVMRLLVAIKSSNKYKKNVIKWEDFLSMATNYALPSIEQHANDLAVLEYTSGTTAEPKAVMLSNRAINTVAFHYAHAEKVFTFHPGEKMLDSLPPFMVGGLVVGLHLPLTMGVQLIMCPNPSPKLTPKSILKYRPNHFLGGTPHIEALVQDKSFQKADLSCLVTVAYGGESREDTWEDEVSQFLLSRGAKHGLINGYGMTEVAGSFCTTTHQTKKMLPFVKNNIKILDLDTGKELTYGQVGEVFISGPSMMDGYYKNSKATADTFVEIDGTKWIRTGDLGTVTEDGFFAVTGRLKRIFFGSGADNIIFRIYPMKIEKVISSLPEIAQCAVVGKRDKDKGYLPIAYVTLHQTSAEANLAIKEKVLNICREKLNPQSQPAEVHILKQLPLTRAGKIDFKKLEEQAQEQETSQ